ncbi:MAG: uridine kinase [Caldilinea sp. CFX5]|nr:uridine kinase [Caldilinea sp. CFX5]
MQSTQSATTPLVIGVAGGSGSGKTTVSERIQRMVGPTHFAYLQHDSYYRDQGHLAPAARLAINYDHPDSLETQLLIDHIQQLRQGQAIAAPLYDFANYTRRQETRLVQPASIILVEGILIFVEKSLCELMDIRIYVDTDADLRFIRRLQRDVQERERSLTSVVEQYLTTVRPMHLEFVEPSKRHADIIVPRGGENRIAMEMIVSRIQRALLQS